MKALTIISLAAAALVALAGSATAQVQLLGVQMVSDQDREFVRMAATGGLAEVEFGRIAQRAARTSVRAFGVRMVTDHSPGHAELASLSRAKGIDVTLTLKPSQQAMSDRLNG